MDEYREGCLKLEKAKHARVYEAEKRMLYMEQVIKWAYFVDVRTALEDHMTNRRGAVCKSLEDVAEKMRRVEELQYGISREDAAAATGTGSRRHDMSLRVRGGGGGGGDERMRIDDDVVQEPEKSRKTRKTDNRHQKVKVQIMLEESDILADLAELRGEKRPREPEPAAPNQPERKTKKKK